MAKAIDLTFDAETREEFGKGAARRIRRASKIPAVLHDHGQDPVHLTLPGHQVMLALRASSNSIFTIRTAAGSALALPRQVQRDPIRGTVEHVDLDVVRRGEKVTVAVSIHVVGEAAPETLIVSELTEVELEADPTAIPERIEVSVEGLAAGTIITAAELTLPEGSTLITDGEQQVVNVTAQQTAAAADAEMAAAEAEAGVTPTETAAAVETEGGSSGEQASASAAAVPQS